MSDAPSNQSYILVNADSSGELSQERILNADASGGIAIQDHGPGNNLTITPTATLASLQAVSSNGVLCRTGTNTITSRNLTGDNTINVQNPDGVNGDPVIGVNDDTSVQQINLLSNGSLTASRAQVNLIPAGDVSITAVDNGAQNRVDVTFSATSPVVQEPVWVSKPVGNFQNPVNIGALTNGLLKISVASGYATPTTAVPGTDYYKPAQPTSSPCSLVEAPTKVFLGGGTGNLTNLSGSAELVAIGHLSLQNALAANSTTALGGMTFSAVTTNASNSTAVGAYAGALQNQYNGCTFVGYNADASVNNLTASSAIGSGATVSTSNTIVLGKSENVVIGGTGSIGNYSLQLAPTTGNANMWMGRSPTANTPGLGGVFSVDNNDNPQFVSATGANSGRMIVSNDTPNTGEYMQWNGTQAVWNPAPSFNSISPITTAGDLIVGNGTNSATRLGIGASGTILTSNGTTATWTAPSAGSQGAPVYNVQSISYGQYKNGGGTYDFSYSNNVITFNNTVAIPFDNANPSVNDLVLLIVAPGGNSAYNGIYTVTTVGTGSAQCVLTRAPFFTSANQMIPGTQVIAAQTFNPYVSLPPLLPLTYTPLLKNVPFTFVTTGAITVGTTNLVFQIQRGPLTLYMAMDLSTVGTGYILNMLPNGNFGLGFGVISKAFLINNSTSSGVTTQVSLGLNGSNTSIASMQSITIGPMQYYDFTLANPRPSFYNNSSSPTLFYNVGLAQTPNSNVILALVLDI